MRTALVFVVVILGIAHSGAEKRLRVQKRYDNGGWQAEPEYQRHEDNHGYSAGSGLRSIAQGSASRAHSAVANQYVAAQQASYIAQTSLAQEAIQAAATAHAALAGKEVLYNGLEKQVVDAEEALLAEIKHLKLAESTAVAAKEAADAASDHIAILASALNNANSAAEHARAAAEEAATEYASQSSMVGRAQGHLNSVKSKWHSAELDFLATRQAAEKASASAQVARENASSAGAYASHKLQESALNNAEESHFQYEVPSSNLYRHHQHHQ